jgi:undecaprenyl-diphosphatase
VARRNDTRLSTGASQHTPFTDAERRHVSGILLTLGGLLFLVGVLAWKYEPRLDQYVRDAVMGQVDTESEPMKLLGVASGTRACFIVATVVGVWFAFARHDWRPSVALLLGLLLVSWGVDQLKGAFERNGPGGLAPPSFPSGHAALAVLVWGYLAWFVPKALPGRVLGVAWFGLSMLILIGTVASRVTLDAHWLTDVMAGVGVGTVALVAAREATSLPLVRRAWLASVPRRATDP